MGKPARWLCVAETSEYVAIKDIGPWNVHFTVTNDAENVVAEIAPRLNGRRLLYIDSEGEPGELKVERGAFAGFGPWPKEIKEL